MKKGNISLQKWMRRYWIGMSLFLVVIYFLGQSYMLMLLTNRAEDNIQNSIHIASTGIEDSLEIVDSFIYESLYSGSTQSTSQLYKALRCETDPITLGTARNTVSTSLLSLVMWSDMIDFILLYTDRQEEDSWLEAGKSDSFQRRREVKRYITEQIESEELDNLGRYLVCNGEQGNYMLRIIKIEGSYLTVGVSEKKILSTLQNSAYDGSCISFATDDKGTVIFSSKELSKNLEVENEGTYIKVNGIEYLQTGYVSDKTGYYFGVLTNRESIMEDMWLFRIMFIVIFLVLIVLVPASFLLIKKYVEKPIESIAQTMNQISEGELDVIVEEKPQIMELYQLVKAFNHMIERVKKLKIEKYEVKLEAQKATMQYLQLQIKPHFYANMLNIIYSLAECRDFETIQNISKAIVNYSRYMFSDANDLVELQREIEHVHYYMEIQEIRYMMQIACEEEIEEGTDGALIPPFIIQSFVENSVKYAFSTKKNCKVKIQVSKDNDKENLIIKISDNGDGYRKELLELNWDDKNEVGHIGLTNVYQRLKLIYGGKAEIKLYNNDGAVTVIRIPYIAMNNIDFEDDF